MILSVRHVPASAARAGPFVPLAAHGMGDALVPGVADRTDGLGAASTARMGVCGAISHDADPTVLYRTPEYVRSLSLTNYRDDKPVNILS